MVQRTRRDRRALTARKRRAPVPAAPGPRSTTVVAAASQPSAAGEAGAATSKEAEPAALVVSHQFESGPAGGAPYTATIRVSGRRLGVTGRPSGHDVFSVTETVPGVVPGSGPVSATSWIYDIAPGEWDVTAELIGPPGARSTTRDVRLPRAAWSWRTWSMTEAAHGPVQTRWALLAPLAASPAVLPGSFTALAVLAFLAALGSQPLFANLLGVDTGAAFVASLAGLVVGIAGAKGWYLGLKGVSRRTLKEGWSVDGFLVTAPLVAILVAGGRGIPVGSYLDVVTPGMFLAVAIGRVGCFMTGCCAGRPTAGWGLWSSDRRIGANRIPAQLIESGLGLTLATVAALLLLGHFTGGSGMVFVAAVLVYAAGRQGLLRLRMERRPFSWRRASSTPTSAATTRA